MKISLRTILKMIALVAVVLAITRLILLQPSMPTSIRTRSEWTTATQRGNCILYVNCEWNIDVVVFGKSFSQFCESSMRNADVQPLEILLRADEQSSDGWQICENLWISNGLYSGGLKNLNGAGRIVWLKDGKVVDSCWYSDIAIAAGNYSSASQVIQNQQLRERTAMAFRN